MIYRVFNKKRYLVFMSVTLSGMAAFLGCGNGLLVPLEISPEIYCAAPGNLPSLSNQSEDEIAIDLESAKKRAEEYESKGWLQEAVWLYRMIPGEEGRANQLEKKLESILVNSPFEVKKKHSLGGSTEKYYIFYPNEQISAVFKPDASDWALDPDAEIGAYLVSKTFQMNLVPATVRLTVDGKIGSAQYFMHEVQDGDGALAANNFRKMMVLDYLVLNQDRNFSNNYLYWARENKVIAIDHGRAFKTKCGVSSEIKVHLETEKTLGKRLRSITKKELYSSLSSVRKTISNQVWDQIQRLK